VDKIGKGDVLDVVAHDLNLADVDSLYVAIGESHLSPQSVATRVIRLFQPEPELEVEPEERPAKKRRSAARGKGVIVEGMDDLLVRLALCCTPVPGDPIVGFLTRGRGVSVHRADCQNAKALEAVEAARMIKVWWDTKGAGTFAVTIQIEALDRNKLLRDVTSAISDHGMSIVSSSTKSGRDGIATLSFTVELADPAHLEHVLAAVRGIDSVYDVYRVVPRKQRT
jgi:GTP pyrophosphokinase